MGGGGCKSALLLAVWVLLTSVIRVVYGTSLRSETLTGRYLVLRILYYLSLYYILDQIESLFKIIRSLHLVSKATGVLNKVKLLEELISQLICPRDAVPIG